MTVGDKSETSVLLGVTDGVALVTLNRPDRLNAISADMGERLDAVMAEAGADPKVRAVVLTGAGRGFCAGADLQRLNALAGGQASVRRRPDDPSPAFAALDAPAHQRSRYVIPTALPKPVIAAINGPAAGVGLALACACDVRFGAPEALFAAVFARRGLTAEAGLAYTLPALVGQGHAADLLLSGRKVGAEEALAMGLLNAVLPADDLLPHALEYARDIAANVSPRSVRVIKAQLLAARAQTFAEAMRRAYDEVTGSLASEDFQEGVAAAREKRAPRFPGR